MVACSRSSFALASLPSSRSRAGQKPSAANHLCSPTLLTVVPRWSPHTTPAAGSLTDRSVDEHSSLSWKPPEEMGEASRGRRYPCRLLCGGLELVAFIRQQLAAVEAEAQRNRPDNGPDAR